MRETIRAEQDLGHTIRRFRLKARLSQDELASRTRLRQKTISDIERGQGGSLKSLFLIVRALKIDLVAEPRSDRDIEGY